LLLQRAYLGDGMALAKSARFRFYRRASAFIGDAFQILQRISERAFS
jgi:hypothetical protein